MMDPGLSKRQISQIMTVEGCFPRTFVLQHEAHNDPDSKVHQEGKVMVRNSCFGLKMLWFAHVCNSLALLLWAFKMLMSLARITRNPVNCN